MKKLTQKEIAKRAGLSEAMVSLILSGNARPSWKNTKILASVTNTPPYLWLEGSPEEIKKAILNGNPDYDRLANEANSIVAAKVNQVVCDVREAAMNSEQCHG